MTGFTGDSTYLLLTRDNEVVLSDKRYTTQLQQECPGLRLEIRGPEMRQRIEDIQAKVPEGEPILAWINANIAEYGGDPDSIFLMGNSAGSAHVAAYLFHEASHLDDGPGVAGAILGSGAFSAGDSEAAYYGADADLREQRTPLGLIESYRGPEIPMFLWSAELDPPVIELSVARMYAKLCERFQRCPRFTQFLGHNHVSPTMSINSVDDAVGLAVLDFIRGTC